MNTNRVARSSTSFFQQMMDTDLKRKSLIVAVALTALGLVAIMASCYRRMSAQKQIKKLEKNDKQQTRPINEKVPAKSNSEKTSIGQQTNQTGIKSEAHSSPKSGPENQYSSPKLSDAFLSPQLQHQAQVIKQNNPKPVQQHSMPHPQDPRKFIPQNQNPRKDDKANDHGQQQTQSDHKQTAPKHQEQVVTQDKPKPVQQQSMLRPQDPRKFTPQSQNPRKDDKANGGGQQHSQSDHKQTAQKKQPFDQISEDERLARALQESEYEFDDKYAVTPKNQQFSQPHSKPDIHTPITPAHPDIQPVKPKPHDQKPVDQPVREQPQTPPQDKSDKPLLSSPIEEQALVDIKPEPDAQQKQPKVPHAPFSKQIDAFLNEVSEKIFREPALSILKSFEKIPASNQKEILDLLNELVTEFENKYPPQHNNYRKIEYGKEVPAYFAQVKGQNSNIQRKYLSLVGIRNMLLAGPEIIEDFAKRRFLGGAHHYDQKKGLDAFKFYTGTVVDLDTELDVKNETDALAKARELIVDFGKRCGLKAPHGQELSAEDVANQLPDRKLHLPGPNTSIHESKTNVDRSNHGIWTRRHPQTGKISYFVNVPQCDVVLSATLRFPYMIAELAWRDKQANNGKHSKEFLDDFFNKGISDMCFNDKIRQFTNFHIEWMAKFDGAETPEETALRQVESGAFGNELKLKGPQQVIQDAFTQIKLTNFFDTHFDFQINDLTLDQWVQDVKTPCMEKLKEKGLWETTLYRTDSDSEFFLLNESSLNAFLKHYYIYVKTF